VTRRQQFAQQLGDYLEYKKEEGVRTLEITAETRALLRASSAASQKAKPAPSASAKPTPAVKPPPVSTVRVTGSTLEAIADQIRNCTACPLHATRKHTVPGEGRSDRPNLMFIGEGPGADEDEQGRPFVGAAGQLLTKMIAATGYQRDEVFIANIVKCRPPGNRIPHPVEMAACLPYLRAQIALVRPKIIIALGKTAVQGLLQKEVVLASVRGKWTTFEGIDLMPTYHPAFLLRSPARKGDAWADLKAALARLGKTPPPVKKTGPQESA
jgi:DNA polymerase